MSVAGTSQLIETRGKVARATIAARCSDRYDSQAVGEHGRRRQRLASNSGIETMAASREATIAALRKSIAGATAHDHPYRYWLLDECIPGEAVHSINRLPYAAPELEGVSGKRELHNATRSYFDVEARQTHPVAEAFSAAFQAPEVTGAISETFGAKLAGTYLRIEYALDIDGFWLEPHSDLGVKMFTMLLYLSQEEGQEDLGTDIYDASKQRVGRSPFTPNTAMIFVPSTVTFHGFEPRPIKGVRRSIIVNYVTDEWRAREQLAYPDQPIAG